MIVKFCGDERQAVFVFLVVLSGKKFNETRVELFGNALKHVSSPKRASLPLVAPLTHVGDFATAKCPLLSFIFACTCAL